MRLAGDWRYVSAGEYDGLPRRQTPSSLREAVISRRHHRRARNGPRGQRRSTRPRSSKQFLSEVPLGLIEMRQAFAAGGDYGDWLRARPAVAG